MTEPDLDFLTQLSNFGDKHIPGLLKEWSKVLKGGGKKTIRHRCAKCGSSEEISFEVMDVEEQRKIIDSLRLAKAEHAKQAKDEDESKAATKILKDLSELSSAQLAGYIADLEAELVADAA